MSGQQHDDSRHVAPTLPPSAADADAAAFELAVRELGEDRARLEHVALRMGLLATTSRQHGRVA